MANNDRESLHIFWTTWGISMKFSGKMWLMMILKVTKNQALTHSLEKRQRGGGGGGSNWPSCSLFRVKMDKLVLLQIFKICAFFLDDNADEESK